MNRTLKIFLALIFISHSFSVLSMASDEETPLVLNNAQVRQMVLKLRVVSEGYLQTNVREERAIISAQNKKKSIEALIKLTKRFHQNNQMLYAMVAVELAIPKAPRASLESVRALEQEIIALGGNETHLATIQQILRKKEHPQRACT